MANQWVEFLEAMIRQVTGPEDEADTNVNGIPDSSMGEEANTLPDEMPGECGWADEEEEDDGDEDDC